ncbi:hypothetical protein LL946_03550 [Knoellia locipacati]|uniref:hypothetical protein n=1 Tax=Knoellia locipacati TaxID=882824 RepID=UPI003850DA49
MVIWTFILSSWGVFLLEVGLGDDVWLLRTVVAGRSVSLVGLGPPHPAPSVVNVADSATISAG